MLQRCDDGVNEVLPGRSAVRFQSNARWSTPGRGDRVFVVRYLGRPGRSTSAEGAVQLAHLPPGKKTLDSNTSLTRRTDVTQSSPIARESICRS